MISARAYTNGLCNKSHKTAVSWNRRRRFLYCEKIKSSSLFRHHRETVVDCGPVPDVVMASTNSTLSVLGTVVEYICNGTMSFNGDLNRTSECMPNGQWTPNPWYFFCARKLLGPHRRPHEFMFLIYSFFFR